VYPCFRSKPIANLAAAVSDISMKDSLKHLQNQSEPQPAVTAAWIIGICELVNVFEGRLEEEQAVCD